MNWTGVRFRTKNFIDGVKTFPACSGRVSNMASGKNARTRSDMSLGWTPSNTLTRLQQLKKNNPMWRSFDLIRVEYTIITQRWTSKLTPTDHVDLRYLCPWGMKDMITKNYSAATCKTFEILPKVVREAFNLEKDTYNKDNINVTVTNSGNMGFKQFNHIYCSVCKNSKSEIKRLGNFKIKSCN